jgi:hypothetical protein
MVVVSVFTLAYNEKGLEFAGELVFRLPITEDL